MKIRRWYFHRSLESRLQIPMTPWSFILYYSSLSYSYVRPYMFYIQNVKCLRTKYQFVGKIKYEFPLRRTTWIYSLWQNRLLQICSQSSFHITDAILFWIGYFGDWNSLKDNIKMFGKELKSIFNAGCGFVWLIMEISGGIFCTR